LVSSHFSYLQYNAEEKTYYQLYTS